MTFILYLAFILIAVFGRVWIQHYTTGDTGLRIVKGKLFDVGWWITFNKSAR